MTTNNSWNSAYNSALGTLLAGDGNRPQVVPVGVDGLVLTADSLAAQGVSWQTGFNPANTSLFSAQATPVANVTGNNTVYQIIFDGIVDQVGTAYNNATGVYTAPVAGWYHFDSAVGLATIGAAHTSGQMDIVVNGGTATIAFSQFNPFATQNIGGPSVSFEISGTYFLNVGDTVTVRTNVAGGLQTVSLNPSVFQGFLVSTAGGVSGIFGPGVSTDRAIATWNGITGTALYDNPGIKVNAAGDLIQDRSDVGATTIALINSSAAATAQANVSSRIEPTAFAAFDNWNVNGSATKNWSAGILQSDGAWYLHQSAAAFPSAAVIKATTAGEVTMPRQPAFFAALSVATGGVTGAGGIYFLGNNGGGTTSIITDQASNLSFVGGDLTFTCAVAGFYLIGFQMGLSGVTGAMTAAGSSLLSAFPAGAINGMACNPGAMADVGGNLVGAQQAAFFINAGTTIRFAYQITGGGADTAIAVPGNTVTHAYGCLLC